VEVSGQLHAPLALFLAKSPPPPYPLDEGLVGTQTGLDVVVVKRKSSIAGNRTRAIRVARRYADRAIVTPVFFRL
jgi:hypothetical protein